MRRDPGAAQRVAIAAVAAGINWRALLGLEILRGLVQRSFERVALRRGGLH
jgi:hypothetical protein